MDSTSALLFNAINTSTVSRLRDTLHHLCSTSPEAHRLVCERLLLPSNSHGDPISASAQKKTTTIDISSSDDDNEPSDCSDNENDDDDGGENCKSEDAQKDRSKPQKRKREYVDQRFQICQQCEEEYDVTLNCKSSCVYHDCELEIDYEASTWWDWDERCHGLMDSKENREIHPEGFIWSCCEEEGTARGCMVGRHRPVDPKKPRIWSA
ncbi:hypothetical protein CC78DRAFT_494649 [Lojkania enalia]|uniref:Uncharacterized protein n=1 Tax=Lojkania enalia TaxID=147567 RepID=A0A9P4KAF9_9PLEO|nr:hypothetical protein CC78DRAFT_494649 [Didymosphaeria enalia]